MKIIPERVEFTPAELTLVKEYVTQIHGITEEQWNIALSRGFDLTNWDSRPGMVGKVVTFRFAPFEEIGTIEYLSTIRKYFVKRGLFKGKIYQFSQHEPEQEQTTPMVKTVWTGLGNKPGWCK